MRDHAAFDDRSLAHPPMTGTLDWQTRVGDVWAAEWRRTDRSLADLSRHLDAAILAAAPARGAVLDIGCGAGATSLALAGARPDLSLTGIDLSPALLAVARARLPAARFLLADAGRDPIDPSPDLFVSRHGVMFFADPHAAFTRLHDCAGAGAGLVFSCFGPVERNAFAADLPQALCGTIPPRDPGYAPGPFAFADREWTAAMLAAAGWRDAAAAPVAFDYVAGEGEDPVADAADFFAHIGPVARLLAQAGADQRPAMVSRLTDRLARYRRGDRVVLPAFAWLWRARA